MEGLCLLFTGILSLFAHLNWPVITTLQVSTGLD